MRRFRVLLALVPLFVILACGKKGLPPECEQYLARYDCWLGKMGTQGKETTIATMRETWTTGSNTAAGRAAIKSACESSQAEMEAKFAQSGCADATPGVK